MVRNSTMLGMVRLATPSMPRHPNIHGRAPGQASCACDNAVEVDTGGRRRRTWAKRETGALPMRRLFDVVEGFGGDVRDGGELHRHGQLARLLRDGVGLGRRGQIRLAPLKRLQFGAGGAPRSGKRAAAGDPSWVRQRLRAPLSRALGMPHWSMNSPGHASFRRSARPRTLHGLLDATPIHRIG